MKSFKLILTIIIILGLAVAVLAEEAWRTEFDDICGRTNDSSSLSKEELTKLVERCDKLMPVIEKLPESPRKLYTKRLKMCRDLFVYSIEVLGNK